MGADVRFENNADEVRARFKELFDKGMELVGQQAESNAIKEVTELVYDTPPSPRYVRTGALRNSIGHKYVPEEKAAYVGTNLEYAPYVELGTRHMHEKPFLRNAAQNYADDYQQILEHALVQLSGK